MLTKAAFDQKYSTIEKYYCNLKEQFFYLNIFQNVIYACDAKLNFQHHYSSLQCRMIPQKSF